MIEAQPHQCEEMVALPGGGVMPCNRSATTIVDINRPGSTEGPYRMCDAHADHSVRNRGMKVMGPYVVPEPLPLPAAMTKSIEEALGQPNFRCGPLAEIFRAAGHKIPHHAEEEQAFVLFWSLKLAIKHGANWRAEGGKELDALLTKAKGG